VSIILFSGLLRQPALALNFFDGGNKQTHLRIDKVLRPSA
jgi:hypothetical protein